MPRRITAPPGAPGRGMGRGGRGRGGFSGAVPAAGSRLRLPPAPIRLLLWPAAASRSVLVSALDLPEAALDLLAAEGYKELYPPQAAAVEAGLLGGRSVLVSAPTASGKTLIAFLSMMAHLSAARPGKIVYLSPLRALASEKFAEFKKIAGIRLGGRRAQVKVSTGETGGGSRLGDGDIIVLTNERMDALMRQGHEWVSRIGLVVADEVHLISDLSRGPTLEMVLTRAGRLASRPQVVGLSATMSNAAEIAEWLGAGLVDSEWRPVSLREGVFGDGSITMGDGGTLDVPSSVRGPAVDIGLDTVKEGGQSLLFAETRVRAASLATKAADAVSKMLGKGDAAALARSADRILASTENTKLVKRLAELVRSGVAFHHAGLAQPCRTEVEEAFRARRIKLLASTPTLAAGVNLPARRVVVASILRYNAASGRNEPISVMEYKQLCGRAGRPQYDDHGEAVVVAPSSYNADEVLDYYVRGEIEPIESKMTGEKAMRTHVLSLVVTTPGIKASGVSDFFAGTLGGRQAGDAAVGAAVDSAAEFLAESEMVVEKGGRLAATDFGKKTSRLYLDPATAVSFRRVIEDAPRPAAAEGPAKPSGRGRQGPKAAAPARQRRTLGLLYEVTDCTEFFPKMSMRREDEDAAADLFDARGAELLRPAYPYECNRGLLALDAWISEATDAALADRLKVEAGDMHRMAEAAEWLLRCMGELAMDLGRADLASEVATLRTRVRYGVSEDLIDLVSVRGIGRVRARALYGSGVRDRAALAAMPVEKLASVDKIGRAVASSIKAQLLGRRGK